MEQEPGKTPEPAEQEDAEAVSPADPPIEEQNPVDTDNPEDNPPLPRTWN